MGIWTTRTHGVWSGPHGTLWCYRVPQTARELLGVQVWLALHLHPAQRSGAAMSAAQIEGLAHWLASVTTDVEGMEVEGAQGHVLGWRHLAPHRRVEALGMMLDARAQGEYLGAVQDGVGLPADVLDGIAKLHEVRWSGGCECRVCSGVWEDASRRGAAYCLYADIPDEVWSIWSLAAPLVEGALLDAQWWVYQAAQHAMVGRGRASQQRERQKRERDEIDELIRKHQPQPPRRR